MKKIITFMSVVIFTFSLVNAYGQSSGGVVVNHSPASTGKYIGSPSICIMPDGTYVCSHDYYGPNSNEAYAGYANVFVSKDKGQTWEHVSFIKGMFWGKIFNLGTDLYMIGVKRDHGNIVIRKSSDMGRSWTKAYNSKTGLLFEGEYHMAPTPVVIYKGRIWKGVEYPASIDDTWPDKYSATVISAPIDSDLLDAKNWRMAEPVPSEKPYLDGKFHGWLEGNVVYDVNSKSLVDILRVHSPFTDKEYAAIMDINRRGTKLSFDKNSYLIKFPGGSKKFTIRYDEVSQKYWALANYTDDTHKEIQADRVRNTLALISSPDLRTWSVNKIIIHNPDPIHHGFQYVDWQFEGNDIICLVRTADDDEFGGANDYHNANYLIFHRISDFRNYDSILEYK